MSVTSLVQDLGALEHLSLLLAERSAQQLIFSNLAQEAGVATDTVRRWVDLLERLHFGFRVRPWFTNVTKALRKEPKWFLRDWSGIDDTGARAETLVACHLLKAVEGWTDMGFGRFEPRYLRDKLKREVDFLAVICLARHLGILWGQIVHKHAPVRIRLSQRRAAGPPCTGRSSFR
jgi:hypothetical protein